MSVRLIRNVILVSASLVMALPAPAAGPTSTASVSLWYILGVSNSTDPAYTAAFGATMITGRVNGGIMLNDVLYTNMKYASLKLFKNSLLPDYDGISDCVQKALAVASTQLIKGPTPSGPNAQLSVKVTGDLQLNEGNQGIDGDMDWTIIEIRSLRSIACEASFYYPERP